MVTSARGYPYELAWRKVIELKYPLHKAQCPRLTHRAWRETWAGTIEEETPGGKKHSQDNRGIRK